MHSPTSEPVLESVINISEGRRGGLIDAIAASAGADLLDVHSCELHNRSVLTVIGEDAARAVTRSGIELLDITTHSGAHPRIGVVDVVPFIALQGLDESVARTARDDFARWAADELGVPTFLYGTERTLPEIRRTAFDDLLPDHGPLSPHPTAGAIAVGLRPPLVAYNLWLIEPDLALARRIAASLRSPSVRALGLAVGDQVQVSMNLIDPMVTGPHRVHALVAKQARIDRSELVGLLPDAVLRRIDPSRWEQLDLAEDRTIEWRLAERARRLPWGGGVDGDR
jgi:glutamate formiminotransferase